MTPGIEPILYHKQEIACVYRKNIPVSGLLFLTPDENPFQIGIHERPKGTMIKAHTHNCPEPLQINEVQEFLYIISGSIKITMLTDDKEVIDEKTLSAGDSILLRSGAHRVEFTDDARIIELKQGPYPGKAAAKNYLE